MITFVFVIIHTIILIALNVAIIIYMRRGVKEKYTIFDFTIDFIVMSYWLVLCSIEFALILKGLT
jgi:hypothetical protein